MRIAFTTKGTRWESQMDPRFGRAEYFVVYDEDKDELSSVSNKDVENEAHGAGPKAAQKLAEQKVKVLITGNGPGGNAATVLQKIGLDCYIKAGEMTVKEAYEAYKNGSLQKF
jgi:predicted Fe-Mo cluster-binding NifX family protein